MIATANSRVFDTTQIRHLESIQGNSESHRRDHRRPHPCRRVRRVLCLADGADRQSAGAVGEMDGGCACRGARGVSAIRWAGTVVDLEYECSFARQECALHLFADRMGVSRVPEDGKSDLVVCRPLGGLQQSARSEPAAWS